MYIYTYTHTSLTRLKNYARTFVIIGIHTNLDSILILINRTSLFFYRLPARGNFFSLCAAGV